MLIDSKSLSPVLVMISSMYVPTPTVFMLHEITAVK